MKNWMQKYEDNKEKTEEDTLQIQLTELIDLVDNAKYYEESKMIEALSKIIGLYEKQKEGGFDFNEKDNKDKAYDSVLKNNIISYEKKNFEINYMA